MVSGENRMRFRKLFNKDGKREDTMKIVINRNSVYMTDNCSSYIKK